MSNDSIESLARKLADSLPGSLRSVREDLEQNFRGVLQTALDKLDLVTREEFEVQEAVLQRTREKLEALEAKVGRCDANFTRQESATPGNAAGDRSRRARSCRSDASSPRDSKTPTRVLRHASPRSHVRNPTR